MSSDNSVEALKGTWDYIGGDDMDDYLKELGIGMVGRMIAKGLTPRLVITEQDGKWGFRVETILKTTMIEFTPNVEFEETTADGRELKGTIRFENGKWIQKMRDKQGKESMATRWVDEQDQQQIILECGQAKVHTVYKRVRSM